MSRQNRLTLLESVVPRCDDPEIAPYKSLLANILLRSVLDYLDDVPSAHKLHANVKNSARKSAQAFFFSEESDHADVPFSFAWIAGHLSERPDALVATIRRYLNEAVPRSSLAEEKRYHFSQRNNNIC